MRLVNCTPHDIVLLGPGRPHIISASDHPARILDPFPTRAPRSQPGLPTPVQDLILGTDVDHLPPPRPGTVYLVSRLVATVSGHRPDLLVPGPLHADPRYGVEGCTLLYRFHPRSASTDTTAQ